MCIDCGSIPPRGPALPAPFHSELMSRIHLEIKVKNNSNGVCSSSRKEK